MNVAPQLTKEEFSDIHNGKCHLYQAIRQLDGILNPSLLTQLNSAMAEIERGLARAYKEDEAAFSNAFERLGEIQKANKNLIQVSTWSMHDVAHDMNAVPFPKATHLTYDAYGEPVTVALKPNSSWVDLWAAADQAIRESEDLHHTFIEAIEPTEEDTNILRLSTGS